jgi:hypothetical protein
MTTRSFTYYMKPPYLWRRANRENPVTKKAPISMRIEIPGFERAEFSTGVKATAAEWNQQAGRLQTVRGMSKEDIALKDAANRQLAGKVADAGTIYVSLRSQLDNPSPAAIVELLRDRPRQSPVDTTLLAIMRGRVALLERKGRAEATISNMNKALNAAAAYLSHKRQSTLQASQVDRAWCRGFEMWMVARPWNGTTIRDYLNNLSQALEGAVDAGMIKENGARGYRFDSEKPKPAKRHLSQQEVDRLAAHRFAHQTLQRVAHIFVFCCYTGLAYADYTRFAREPQAFISYEPDPLGRPVKGFDMIRQKMHYKGKGHWVPLFPEADQMLTQPFGELPIYERSYVDKKLKVIAEQTELSLPDLKHKDARSTFAQMMRERYSKSVAASLGMHTEAMAQKHYSSEAATTLIKDLMSLGAPLITTEN